MSDVKNKARELLAAEYIRAGHDCAADKIIEGYWDNHPSIQAVISALTPPDYPDEALLVSMATCLNHGFGMDTPARQRTQLHEMRKLWDEVMGRGYYSPENRERYLSRQELQ